MSRPPRGVYVAGDSIVRFGYRDREPKEGEEFHQVTEAGQRLLRDEDLEDLKWDGTSIVKRSDAEIDERELQETKDTDDKHFDNTRRRAVVGAIVQAVNRRLKTAGLPTITRQELVDNYKAILNR